MFAFLAPLATRLFWGTLVGKAKTNAVNDWHAIPPKVRLWIIGIIAVVVLGLLHQWYAHRQLKAQYNAGYAQATADIKAAEAKKVAKLSTIKTTSDARIDAKNEEVRKNYAAQGTHIDSNVGKLLSMYDAPGGSSGVTGSGVHQADGAGGAVPAHARPDDGLAAQPAAGAEPTINLPAKQVITRFGICDRDYIALKAWEQTYQNYMVEYNDWLAQTRKVK